VDGRDKPGHDGGEVRDTHAPTSLSTCSTSSSGTPR
jgi:hypothetical protein